MAKEPKADMPRCDVPGCGMPALTCTDGTEKDSQGLGRKAVLNINICGRHANWPHSEDALRFTTDAATADRYKARGK
jgi:hypothetical protein